MFFIWMENIIFEVLIGVDLVVVCVLFSVVVVKEDLVYLSVEDCEIVKKLEGMLCYFMFVCIRVVLWIIVGSFVGIEF